LDAEFRAKVRSAAARNNDLSDDADLELHHFPRGRALAGIAVSWLLFGALGVTNLFYPPFGEGPPFTVRFVAVGMFASVLWMLATPPVFWLTSRFSVERDQRAPTIAFYLVIAFALAFTVAALGGFVRREFVPPPVLPPGRVPRERPIWGLTRARLLNDYTIALAIFATGVARDYFARYQRRLEESTRLRAQLVEARLSALQSQLNPHFLFNTLNGISALVDRDPKGVRRMIARLGELLRATLEPSSEPEVSLSRELEMLDRYLEILRIRFQGRLETSVNASPAIGEALVPPMILQPLVENSMKHAVSRTSGESRVDISAEHQGDSLVLTVKDSGAQNAPEPAAPSFGIGLRNTRSRLGALYGDQYSLDTARNESGGFTATIRIPYHTKSDLRAGLPAARERR
jgi:two-component system LytT family sensor kinase